MLYKIEEIKPQYDAKICAIIKRVGEEYGALGDGYGPSDDEVTAMSKHYTGESSSRYFVASIQGTIIGGGGVAPFNSSQKICELRKLFLLPESRGLGLGKKITEQCLAYAKNKGYQQCYLDTLENMTSAISLYEKLGFKYLDKPLEGTIHQGCNIWMLKDL